jgi:CheY-like chemotaxis protein
LKYTPAGGRVTIRVAEEDGQAVLEISDTGAGLPSALLGRIFDLFVQGERALDRAQGGLGIGLTIVKALVVLHGGTVTVRSEGPGHGSVFTVHLPSSSRPGEARRPALPSAPASARRRILIIEDNEDARVMLRTQLALDGHDIHEAADGYAGIDKATAVVPDVVLVDVGLPGLDGYEVARRIRAERNGQAVRLVAITGYGQPEDRSRALEAGFDVHLTKPVSPEQLAEVLAESVRTQSTEVTRGDAIVPEPSV